MLIEQQMPLRSTRSGQGLKSKVVKGNIPAVFLIGDAVSYHIPHGYPDDAEKKVVNKTICNGNFQREIIDKIENGKVDPHQEDPRTKINGNRFGIGKTGCVIMTFYRFNSF